MEKLAERSQLGIPGVVVPMSAGWSDVGAWDARCGTSWKRTPPAITMPATATPLPKAVRTAFFTAAGVWLRGRPQEHRRRRNPDAVLVATLSRTQDVKKIVTRLKAEGRKLADITVRYSGRGAHTIRSVWVSASRSTHRRQSGGHSACRCIITAPNTGSWSGHGGGDQRR